MFQVAFSQITLEKWSNGNKKMEGMTIDGVKKGVWKFWDETGDLKKEIEYGENGEILTSITWAYSISDWLQTLNTGIGTYWENGHLIKWEKYSSKKEKWMEIVFLQGVDRSNLTMLDWISKKIDSTIAQCLLTVSSNYQSILAEHLEELLHGFYEPHTRKIFIEFLSQVNKNSLSYELNKLHYNLICGIIDNKKISANVFRYNARGWRHLETYYENGTNKKGYEFTYFDQDIKKIKTKITYLNGEIIDEIAYDFSDTSEYTITTFYVPGLVKEIQNYKAGKKDGMWKGYYLNKSVQYVEYYKDGKKHGTCTYADENGNVTKKEKYSNGILK